ncbi:ABC transporter permease [Candidatus Bipolaricaulota bacterium]|nr:ABC transporter permease [Candidatus Bipolaricaulota bacterium]
MMKTFRKILKNPSGLAGAIIVAGLLLTALFTFLDGTFFERRITSSILHDPLKINIPEALQGPSSAHPLGQDRLGRDILARILYGSQVAVATGFVATGLATIMGVFLGVVTGYFGGIVDDVIMRVLEIIYSIPTLVLAMIMMSVLGPGLLNAMIAVAIMRVPSYTRVIRSQALSLREMDYIAAARACGSSNLRILLRHLIPNCIAPTIVQATLGMGSAILTVASFSFLGFGIQPPGISWGSMLSEGRDVLLVAPHVATFPGIAIFLTVLGFNLLGDTLRDILDPRLRGEI